MKMRVYWAVRLVLWVLTVGVISMVVFIVAVAAEAVAEYSNKLLEWLIGD